MARQFITILIRNISKSPLYSSVNFIGLTLSLAVSLLIFLWIYDELSFDKMHENHDHIYRVLTFKNEGGEFVKTPALPLPFAAFLREEYPQVESATFVKYEDAEPLQIGDKKIEAIHVFVDSHFFEVFTGYQFIEGNALTAISEPQSIILSEKTARILFGEEKALGKTHESNMYGIHNVFKVGGVVKVPYHSHIDFGFATLIDQNQFLHRTYINNWKRHEMSSVYLKLRKNSAVSSEFITSINSHFSRQTGKAKRVLFQPIANIHLFSDYVWQYDKNLGDYTYILVFGGLAICIVILAIFNFILLTIARASERFCEIGYRKIVGATRAQVFFQYITESFVQVLLAVVSGLLLAYLLLPWFNNLTGKMIYFIPTINFFGTTLLLAILISLCAGIYPALYLSSYNPLLIFKGGHQKGSKNVLLRILITIQSAASMILLIFTVMVYQQIRHINSADLGMNKENIVVIPTGLWYDNEAFKSELLQNPHIVNVSFSTRSPADFHFNLPLSVEGADTVYGLLFWVDQDFSKTYDLKMEEGEFIKATYKDHWTDTLLKKDVASKNKYAFTTPVVINETARDAMQLDDPIGARIGNKVVVGVVKDFHHRSLKHKISPMVMINNPENIMTMNVKISSEDKATTIRYIRDTYAKHRPDRGFSYSYFEDQLNDMYRAEQRMGKLLTYSTAVAFLISLMGIFSLANYSTNRRTQEIGIRKVNGASIFDIWYMLNLDFLTWIVLAFLLALPIAFHLTNQWLMNFAFRTSISWWIVLFIGTITILVSLLSVSHQCWRASRKNAIDVLRSE